MENPELSLHTLLLLMVAFLSVQSSNQIELSQTQTILKIKHLLNYPSSLSSPTSSSSTLDFCDTEPTQSLTLICYEGEVTQLHITGDKTVLSLPQSLSARSLFASLGKLSSLKVLTLASLGLSGPIPRSIGHLSALEILNVSSNNFNGGIPAQILNLRNLHTLILDNNRFSGKIPFWLNSLPMLTVLSLRNNSLRGSLPESLGSLRNLRILSLSENHLSGEVPNLSKLINLQAVDLTDNGFGPHFPSLPRKIVTLVLKNNRFRSSIPEKLTSFYLLQKLDISSNGFVGPFSSTLLSLPSIAYLDISDNKLTGVLSENMSCSVDLSFVNLSSNYLVGKLPSCLTVTPPDSRTVLYSGNCLQSEGQRQHPSAFCHKEALAVEVTPHGGSHKVERNKPVLASGLAGAFLGIIVVVGLVSMLIKKFYTKNSLRKHSTRFITENVSTVNTAKLLSNAKYISDTMKMGASLPAYRTFALEDLKEATNNFSTSTLMGQSSNDQVYRGTLFDGTLVAIRSLKMRKKRYPQAYTHHLEMISKLRHCHLVSALGHCLECLVDDTSVNRIFLVFEFVSNGTLRDWISGSEKKTLDWNQRITAAIGVTKGVQFLHTGTVPGVYSNNLKITNVLMDHDLQPKISTYNLLLLTENVGSGSSTLKGGSQERANHEDKSDVYDIGVIILELIIGRPIAFHNEVASLKDLVRTSVTAGEAGRRIVVDPTVQRQCSDESLKTTMEICVRCLSSDPSERPSVEDILWTLQFAAQLQDSGRRDSMNGTEAFG